MSNTEINISNVKVIIPAGRSSNCICRRVGTLCILYSISYKELAAKATKLIFLHTARMCGGSWYLIDVCHFIGGSSEEVVVIRTDTGLDEEGTTFMALITMN